MVADMRGKGLAGQAFADALERVRISVNAVPIAYDPSPIANGVRIGCTVTAQRGMAQAEMDQIADIMARIAAAPEDVAVLETCAREVTALTQRFPLYGRYDARP